MRKAELEKKREGELESVAGFNSVAGQNDGGGVGGLGGVAENDSNYPVINNSRGSRDANIITTWKHDEFHGALPL